MVLYELRERETGKGNRIKRKKKLKICWGKFWVGSKFKRSLDPTIRKETGKKKFWCHLARIVAVKGKERNEKKLKKLKSKDKDKQ